MNKLTLRIVLLAITSVLSLTATANSDVKIQWIGGPTMLIEFDGLRIITDPMFGEGENAFVMGDPNEMFDLTKGPRIIHHKRINPLPEVDLANIDLVLLSHAHEDHFDQKAQALLDKKLPMILPTGDLNNVQAKGFTNLTAAKPDQAFSYRGTHGEVIVNAIPADHTENEKLQDLLGHGLGYVMTFKKAGKTLSLYWTGDSMATPKVVKFVKQFEPINVLVPNMGRVGTTGPLGQISLGAKEVEFLANTFAVEKVFPIHHTTYELYLEPISELAKLAQGKEWGLDVISEGSMLVY